MIAWAVWARWNALVNADDGTSNSRAIVSFAKLQLGAGFVLSLLVTLMAVFLVYVELKLYNNLEQSSPDVRPCFSPRKSNVGELFLLHFLYRENASETKVQHNETFFHRANPPSG